MIPKIEDIHRFTIIGSGTLGARIGLRAALSGFNVTLYDIDNAAFARAKKDFNRIKKMMLKMNQCTESEFDSCLSNILYTTHLKQACEGSDFISESVIEDVELKKKVWTDIAPLVQDSTVLTTNTSYLLPSMFAEECGAPERFCAFHFHDVFTARVVDIMPHPNTHPSLITLLQAVGNKLYQIPVVIKKESQGYVFNKMFGSILLTAGSIWARGIASIEDIDRSWMGNYGMKIGPFGMMDEVGIDTVYHVAKGMDVETDPVFLKKIKEMIGNGTLGIKTGEGFYTYPQPKFKAKDFLS